MGPQLYCHGKYESTTSDCNADPLCVWSKDSDECEIADYLAASTAGLSARKVNQRRHFAADYLPFRFLLIL